MASKTTDKRISDVVDLLKISDDPTRREAVDAIENLVESVKEECLEELESQVESKVEEGLQEIDLEDEIDNRVDRWANNYDFGDLIEETLKSVDVASYMDSDDLQREVKELGFIHEDDLVDHLDKVGWAREQELVDLRQEMERLPHNADLESLRIKLEQYALGAAHGALEQLKNRGLWGRLKWILTGK